MLISLKAAPGDRVVKGQIVAVVLILKMENPVPSDWDGIVQEVPVKLKARIKRGQVLMTVVHSPDGKTPDCGRSALHYTGLDPQPIR